MEDIDTDNESLWDEDGDREERFPYPDDADVRMDCVPRISFRSIFSQLERDLVHRHEHGAPLAEKILDHGITTEMRAGSSQDVFLPLRPMRQDDRSPVMNVFLPSDPADLFRWHPNRTHMAIVQALAHHLPHKNMHRRKSKGFDPIATIRAWVTDTTRETVYSPLKDSVRLRARDLYRRVIAQLTNVKIREVAKRTMDVWANLPLPDRFRWHLLNKIAEHRKTSHLFHIVFPYGAGKNPCEAEEKGLVDLEKEDPVWTGYGFVLSYNTKLGQNDPDIIKMVQSGLVGPCLHACMKTQPIYKEAFEDLWTFAVALGDQYKLRTVNVAMEHSDKGDHPARVHFHVFIGLDLQHGIGFAKNPFMVSIPRADFVWRGISPHVKCTNTQRKQWGAIYQAVATGSYYVAGPKSSCIMKRSTLEPIEETCHAVTC